MALAGDAHMSTSYLADIEHDRTVPTLGRLQAVATALEVTVRDLLQGVWAVRKQNLRPQKRVARGSVPPPSAVPRTGPRRGFEPSYALAQALTG